MTVRPASEARNFSLVADHNRYWPRPESREQRQFITKYGLQAYLLVYGARQEAIAKIQNQIADNQLHPVISAAYHRWGWIDNPAMSLEQIAQQLSPTELSGQNLAAAVEHLLQLGVLVKSSPAGPDDSALFRPALNPTLAGDELQEISALIADQPAEYRRRRISIDGPGGAWRRWGRTAQSWLGSRGRITDGHQLAIFDRLFYRALESEFAITVDQLTYSQKNIDRQQLEKSLQRLIDIQAVRRSPTSRCYTLAQSELIDNQPEDSPRPLGLSVGQLGALSQPENSENYLLYQGGLEQAKRWALARARNRLQRLVIKTIANVHQQEPIRQPGQGIRHNELLDQDSLSEFSAASISEGLLYLERYNLIRSRPDPHSAQRRYLLVDLDLDASLDQRPPQSEIETLIVDYGLAGYYIHHGRAIYSAAIIASERRALFAELQFSWRLLAPLVARALLSEQRRMITIEQIWSEIDVPEGNNEQSKGAKILEQLAGDYLLDRVVGNDGQPRYGLRIV